MNEQNSDIPVNNSAANNANEASQPAQASPQQNSTVTITVPWYKSLFFWLSAILMIAIILLLGHMIYQKYLYEQDQLAKQQAELQALKNRNDAVEDYLLQLKKLLELDPCSVAPALQAVIPPEGYSLPVLTPPSGVLPPAPAPSPQAAPAEPAPQQQTPKEPQKPAGPLAAQLEQATVCLIALDDGVTSMGSGFFITKDLIMTNAHVVKGAKKVIFINKATGIVQPARIAMFTEENGLDFAVLQTKSPCAVTPLKLQEKQPSRTEKVSAWGYPGAVTTQDPKFNALIHGDVTAAPEVVYSDGTINVVLERTPPIIVHSAVVSHGNSGGPLVNEQGEVVGINTAISLDDKSYRQSSFAIPSTSICQFLNENGIPYTPAQGTH